MLVPALPGMWIPLGVIVVGGVTALTPRSPFLTAPMLMLMSSIAVNAWPALNPAPEACPMPWMLIIGILISGCSMLCRKLVLPSPAPAPCSIGIAAIPLPIALVIGSPKTSLREHTAADHADLQRLGEGLEVGQPQSP